MMVLLKVIHFLVSHNQNQQGVMTICVCVDEVVKLWVYGALERVPNFILAGGLTIFWHYHAAEAV